MEVSGKEYLIFRGNVDTSAANGKSGTLLLDPTNITVINGLGSFTSLTDVDNVLDPDNPPNTIDVNLINNALSNVILQATNDINFQTSVNVSAVGVGLTAQAGRDINFNDSISTNGGALNFSAGRNIIGANLTGNISTSSSIVNAGNVTLAADGNIIVNSIQATSTVGDGGNVTINTGGNIKSTGTSDSIVTNSSTVGNAGNISLTSTNGEIDVSSGRVQAVAFNGNSGNITFNAFGNITTGSGIFPFAAVSSFIAFGGSGNAGFISFTSTAGSIDTSQGYVDASGNNITFQAAQNIRTQQLNAIGTNVGGTISLISTGGSIDTSIGSGVLRVDATNGSAGNIFIQAAGDIKTRLVNAQPITGLGGQIQMISGSSIDTTLGAITVNGSNGDAGSIFLQSFGNISTGQLTAGVLAGTGNAGQITLISSNGAINTSTSTVRARTLSGVNGLGGKISFQADGNITTGEILATGSLGGGTVKLTSQNGAINTIPGVNIDTSSTVGNGGDIIFSAYSSITTNALIAKSDFGNGGRIDLDPIGDIVFTYADTSGAIQGGNFRAFSSGGNIRATSTNPLLGSCFGSSICTAGGTGGLVFIRHGGLNPFIIGDPSKNGTLGTVTTGTSTLELGKVIPVGTSIFAQGNIAIAPSGNAVLEPPSSDNDKVWKLSDVDEQKLLGIRNVLKEQVDLAFQKQDLAKAFDLIERAYVSELEIFLGNSLKVKPIDIANAQDILGDIAKRTGSAAALIYPIVLSDRLEIMVIPPKDKGKPFSVSNRADTEQVMNDVLVQYRSELIDSSSNDYLANAQKLYNWIMRPIDAELQARKIDTVVFVMDSGLRVIPPGALHDGKQFLVERYAAVNIAALRLTRLEDRDRKNTRILAMGLTESVSGFSALPSVEVEIRTINSKLLAGTSLLNKEFTVSNLQAQRLQNDYGIVHLATHGKFVSDNANDSFIQFWDSQLTLERIPRLRFDSPVVEMLTLSACETSVGNNLGISG
ncbi:CHAT domain-containing protein, partial [Microcystis sp. M53BS1]|uniref:CHAT domain-containing protein n=1 Tax=Microcystis sp. M53BS1 TaxID=2771197 RepID=UPI0025870B34